MQIHELNNFTGILGSDTYLAIDNGTDTSKVSAQALSDMVNPRIGTPLVAATAAAMTDHDKIYVYVGSETGYTNGNWYYWNGSAWASGGVYNSTAFVTDTTLTQAGKAADAKVTGDEITDLKSDIDAIYEVQLDAGTMESKKAIGRDGTLINANDSCASGFIEIIPKKKLHIDNVLISGARSICVYDANQGMLSRLYWNSSATSVEFVVPDNAYYIRVTSPNNTKPILRYVDIVDSISGVIDYKKWNLLDDVAVRDEYILDTDGTLTSSSVYYTACSISVEPNKTYRSYSESSDTAYKARRIRFLDNNYAQIGSVVNFPEEFTTPSTARFIDVSFHYKTAASYEKYYDYIALIDTAYVNTANLNGIKVSNDDITGKIYPYMPYRRPLIAFIFDGEYNYNDEFKALFDAHNVKSGFALPYTTAFSHSSMSDYLQWQSEGFEILAHSAVAVGTQSTATDAEIAQIVEDSYYTLYKYGFNIKGFVAYQGNAKPIAVETAQKIFDYAATKFNHSGDSSYPIELQESNLYFQTDAPYALWRYSMQSSTLQQMKDAVDRCIDTNGLLLFYGHANSSVLDNMTLANIETLLEYIENKGILILTPSEAISDYYAIRYQDVVAN